MGKAKRGVVGEALHATGQALSKTARAIGANVLGLEGSKLILYQDRKLPPKTPAARAGAVMGQLLDTRDSLARATGRQPVPRREVYDDVSALRADQRVSIWISPTPAIELLPHDLEARARVFDGTNYPGELEKLSLVRRTSSSADDHFRVRASYRSVPGSVPPEKLVLPRPEIPGYRYEDVFTLQADKEGNFGPVKHLLRFSDVGGGYSRTEEISSEDVERQFTLILSLAEQLRFGHDVPLQQFAGSLPLSTVVELGAGQ